MRAYLLLLTMIFSGLAIAENVPSHSFTFMDNDTIPVQLSSLNLNRLVVKDDHIINFTCPTGFCTGLGNKNDKSGSINVRINVALPFNAHVTTQKGRNFSLFINPVARPAVVTEFIGIQNAQTQKSVFDQKFDYPLALAEMTRSMINWKRYGYPISGFSVHHVDPKTLPKNRDSIALIPQTVFVGKDYSGIIYQVKNQSKKDVTLTNAQFYSYAARSASLDDFSLKAGETTTLYVVTGGGVDNVSSK